MPALITFHPGASMNICLNNEAIQERGNMVENGTSNSVWVLTVMTLKSAPRQRLDKDYGCSSEKSLKFWKSATVPGTLRFPTPKPIAPAVKVRSFTLASWMPLAHRVSTPFAHSARNKFSELPVRTAPVWSTPSCKNFSCPCFLSPMPYQPSTPTARM